MSTRREQKEAARSKRAAEAKAKSEAEARRKRLLGVLAAAILAAGAVVAILFAAGVIGGDDGGPGTGASSNVYPDDAPPLPEATEFDMEKAAEAAGCEVVDPPSEGANHIEDPNAKVEYKRNPPTSGDHYVVPAEDGAYDVAPPLEHTTHSLEHGRIFIQFNRSVSPPSRGQLKRLFDEDPYHMLLAPNDTMEPAVAASAWDHALECPAMNDRVFDAIRTFKDEYRDKGPEFVN